MDADPEQPGPVARVWSVHLLGKLEVDEIAMALSDQTDHEHRWLIDALSPGVWYLVLTDVRTP